MSLDGVASSNNNNNNNNNNGKKNNNLPKQRQTLFSDTDSASSSSHKSLSGRNAWKEKRGKGKFSKRFLKKGTKTEW